MTLLPPPDNNVPPQISMAYNILCLYHTTESYTNITDDELCTLTLAHKLMRKYLKEKSNKNTCPTRPISDNELIVGVFNEN